MSGTNSEESPLAFLLRLRDALLRVCALALMGFVDWLLQKGIRLIVPSHFGPAVLFLEGVSFVFFAIIYVYLLWDMVKVFMPWVQRRLAIDSGKSQHV